MKRFSADSPWRLDQRVTFLNHGSFGARPEAVVEAQQRWRERMDAEPIHFLDDELEDHLDAARAMIGEFLHADPEGLAFTSNATTGVATVLGSLRFEPGDELLTTDHEYNATLNVLAAAAARDGARVVVARIPFPIASDEDAYKAVIDAATPRTRLGMISHVTSPTGLILPIEAIVGELDPGGWPAIMAANRKLALQARDLLAHALDVAPPAPDSMLGGMAALTVPGLTTDDDAGRLHRVLLDADRIQVPVVGWPVRAAREDPKAPPQSVVIRISANRYNEPADYERLADALRRQLPGLAGRRLTAE
jgi:selenocysteine lyase/cysteine desulfurase